MKMFKAVDHSNNDVFINLEKVTLFQAEVNNIHSNDPYILVDGHYVYLTEKSAKSLVKHYEGDISKEPKTSNRLGY